MIRPISIKRPGSTAPASLSPEAAKWWDSIMQEYDIADIAGQLLLQTALEAFDRLREAQAAIQAGGLIVEGPRGGKMANVAVMIERDSRSAMLAAFKLLNLSVEPLQGRRGRPGR